MAIKALALFSGSQDLFALRNNEIFHIFQHELNKSTATIQKSKAGSKSSNVANEG